MLVEVIVALARAILADRERREQAAADEELANSIVARISAAIDRAKNEILDFLRQQRLDDLAGRVDGLFDTFQRYAADPRANHDRLVRLIDELAQLIGIMNRLLTAGDERQLFAVYPTYATAVSISLVAISERRHRFGVNEITAGLPQEAKAHTERVKATLRRRSDLRFHLATRQSEPGSFDIGYTFNDQFHFVDIVFGRNTPPRVIERVRREIEAHREREFPLFPGVRELQLFLDELEETIRLEDSRDLAEMLPPLVDVAPAAGIALALR
jgi:hypothetical protein